jgi:hypothetical protein
LLARVSRVLALNPWKKALPAVVLVIVGSYFALRESTEDERASRAGELPTPGDRIRAGARQIEAERPRAVARLQAIQEELRDLGDHPWAGVYGWGNERGETLRMSLAPKNGFAFFRSTPEGNGDLNHGDIVSVDEGRIQVQLALDPEIEQHDQYLRQSLAPIADEFFVLDWGTRRYLIAKPWMQAFCNAVNDGSERAKPHFPHHLDRGTADPSAAPLTLPLAYRDWLLREVVTAQIVQVGDGKKLGDASERKLQLPLTATINEGRNVGLLPGMVVWLVDQPGYAEGEILASDEHSSKVEFRFTVGNAVVPERLRLGWKVSTLRPEYVPKDAAK